MQHPIPTDVPKILDRTFNVAVLAMAARVCPAGYDVGDDAPDTFEKLNTYVRDHRRIKVWSGGSDKTIFGDREVNYAFRAWHDWTHWRYGCPFTPEGEAETARRQIMDMFKVFGVSDQSRRWAQLIWLEIVGQGEHLAETGEFVDDQYSFVAARFLAMPDDARPWE